MKKFEKKKHISRFSADLMSVDDQSRFEWAREL